jgi:hypothetical protein
MSVYAVRGDSREIYNNIDTLNKGIYRTYLPG